MTKREIVIDALKFRPPRYVPWSWSMTKECEERFRKALHIEDMDKFTEDHFFGVACITHGMEDIGGNCVRDKYGVVWDRSIDKDIGTPSHHPLQKPEDLAGFQWPATYDKDFFDNTETQLVNEGEGLFRVYATGFSLFERAWTLRGMTELLMDMIEWPRFVEKLLDSIAEHHLGHIHHALKYDFDCFKILLWRSIFIQIFQLPKRVAF